MALYSQVDLARHELEKACETGGLDSVHRHSARLLDLLERAAAHGVDTNDWVSPELLSVALTAAGNGA